MGVHDGLVLLTPLLLHFLKLRLADHGLDPRTEMAGNAPHLRHPAANSAQRHRQILGTDDNDRDNGDHQHLVETDVEHGSVSPA